MTLPKLKLMSTFWNRFYIRERINRMQQQYENIEIGKPHQFKIWWELLRPHTLTAGFVPVTIGTALAIPLGPFHPGLFFAMLLAVLLIQTATNLFNEYYDFKRGLDTKDSIGIGGAIVRNGIQPKTVMAIALGCLIIAFLLGIYICIETSWWIAVVGSICMVAGYLYTGGPRPIAYTPFGEVTAGLFMGLTIIVLSFYIQANTISLQSVLVSLPISILIGAILHANNIRDLDGDKQNGRKTVAILLGHNKAITLLGLMFILSYTFVLMLVITSTSSPWLLLVFLSLPKAIQATKGFKGKTLPIQMMPAMKATAQTNTIFGFLLAIGLLLTYWL
jgi:1,4-dihydroxy-2-naphthoate octaprenyltransferase